MASNLWWRSSVTWRVVTSSPPTVAGSRRPRPRAASDEDALTRTVRLLLVVLGLSVVALLVRRAGPHLVFGMLTGLGWNFVALTSIYTTYVMIRAAALRRVILRSPMRYADALRIKLSGDAVEGLTFTGPFLAEPAKGWLLKKGGLPSADAFGAVVTEYLLYTVTSSWLAISAVSLLLLQGTLPPAVRIAAVVALVVAIAFVAAFAFASVSGIGLIAPILRASGILIGTRRADSAAQAFVPIETLVIAFLHGHPARLAKVLILEAAAQLLLITEIWVVIPGLGFALSWNGPFILEGGVKFIATVFAFIPGQVGASEGVYSLLAGAIGLPPAVGLTLALVRRIRGLLVASVGVVVLAFLDGG